jgi:transposase
VETARVAAHQKKARRLNAHVVFPDESGFQLTPSVRRTWAPRGQTPLIHHWDRRDKVSAISAVSVSPRRQRLGFYMHVHPGNLTTTEVAIFVRDLLRHLRGPVILVWDQGPIHKGPAMRQLRARYPRLHLYEFPSYAPELNPDELVWGYTKRELANGRPLTRDALFKDVVRVGRKVRRRPTLLRSFIVGSDLPSFLRK